LGPVQDVRGACQRLEIKRRLVSGGIGLILLSLGLLTITQSYRRRDTVSRWFGLMAMAASAKSLHFGVIDPPFNDQTWTLIFYCTRLLYAPIVFVFISALVKSPIHRLTQWIVASLHGLFVIIYCFAEPADWHRILIAQGGVYMLLASAAVVGVIKYQRQQLDQQDLVITWIILISIFLHSVDYYRWLTQSELHLSGVALTTFPILFVSVVLMLMEKGNRQLALAEETALQLSTQVDEQALAVEAANREVKRIRDEAMLATERRRIMRDMHDGVGSHLIGAVSLLSGSAENKVAVELVENALLEIRSTVDALGSESTSLDALLGSFRHRIEPMLTAHALTLHWDVHGLAPDLKIEDADQRLTLLRLIQDVFSNTLKHSQATKVLFYANSRDALVTITMTDNGVGFDVPKTKARAGLNSLEARAERLGAQFALNSSPLGTTVELRMQF
jgi:signal transduction histidine kinase